MTVEKKFSNVSEQYKLPNSFKKTICHFSAYFNRQKECHSCAADGIWKHYRHVLLLDELSTCV